MREAVLEESAGDLFACAPEAFEADVFAAEVPEVEALVLEVFALELLDFDAPDFEVDRLAEPVLLFALLLLVL